MKKQSTRRRKTRVSDRANRQSIKAWKIISGASDGSVKATVEQITASYYLCLLSEWAAGGEKRVNSDAL